MNIKLDDWSLGIDYCGDISTTVIGKFINNKYYIKEIIITNTKTGEIQHKILEDNNK